MDDKDGLYFSFDEQGEPQPEKEVKAEEGQNRTFLIGAIALAAVFVLGICAVVAFLFFGNQLKGGVAQGPSPNELTNQYLMTQVAFTQTANALTQSAPTAEATQTPSKAKATSTPTSSISQVTPLGVGGTQIAEVTSGPGTPGTPTSSIAEVTVTKGLSGAVSTPGKGTGTPSVSATPTTKPTSSIIEVTPLGGGPTPTRMISGVGGTATSSIIEVSPGGQGGGSISGAGGTPTGQGGPIQPSLTATLPKGGFGGGVGLAGAGLLAVLLVIVVVVVRKIRLQQ